MTLVVSVKQTKIFEKVIFHKLGTTFVFKKPNNYICTT